MKSPGKVDAIFMARLESGLEVAEQTASSREGKQHGAELTKELVP